MTKKVLWFLLKIALFPLAFLLFLIGYDVYEYFHPRYIMKKS